MVTLIYAPYQQSYLYGNMPIGLNSEKVSLDEAAQWAPKVSCHSEPHGARNGATGHLLGVTPGTPRLILYANLHQIIRYQNSGTYSGTYSGTHSGTHSGPNVGNIHVISYTLSVRAEYIYSHLDMHIHIHIHIHDVI